MSELSFLKPHTQNDFLPFTKLEVLFLRVKLLYSLYLLINGGIAASCCHPHLLVETITDGVRQVNAGVRVSSKNSSGQKGKTDRENVLVITEIIRH